MNKSSKFIPTIIAVSVIIGILIGTFYANRYSGNRLNIINTTSNKLNDLLYIIDDQYVDKVDISELVEQAMPNILSELDPHSSYISAKDAASANDELKGSFSGIGVQFTIKDDTVHVFRKFTLIVVPEYELTAVSCKLLIQSIYDLFQVKLRHNPFPHFFAMIFFESASTS